MSYIGEALTYITGLLASPFVGAGVGAEQQQPSEESTSYFPKTASSQSSRRSSISSTSTDSASAAPKPPTLARSYTGTNPLPPLAREFPPPKDELCITTQLSLEPPKRSLHDSLRRAATEERRRPRVDDPETKAQKLAAAKQELLALAGRR
ncbi:uncharacterized protein PG998_002471 [Apiospora kogelbergensis]|uniref:Uncharacterized protein n=1 Tax=Apiospora kogelbergensis TaxID=1337665 RepID=A0AAW0Q833_9PEZI